MWCECDVDASGGQELAEADGAFVWNSVVLLGVPQSPYPVAASTTVKNGAMPASARMWSGPK